MKEVKHALWCGIHDCMRCSCLMILPPSPTIMSHASPDFNPPPVPQISTFRLLPFPIRLLILCPFSTRLPTSRGTDKPEETQRERKFRGSMPHGSFQGRGNYWSRRPNSPQYTHGKVRSIVDWLSCTSFIIFLSQKVSK